MRRLTASMAVVAALAAAPAAGIGHTAARLRVGYLTDAGATSDGAVGERLYRGFIDAVRDPLTLRNGGVGLGRISAKVPRRFLRRLDWMRRQIVSGRTANSRVPG